MKSSNKANQKILYVDDDIANLNLFQILFAEKFPILVASNTTKAIELLEKNNDIKLLISDRNMPDMDGVEFVNQMHKKYPYITYYMFSGQSQQPDIDKYLDTGIIKKYFSKPFNQYELEKEIERVLNS